MIPSDSGPHKQRLGARRAGEAPWCRFPLPSRAGASPTRVTWGDPLSAAPDTGLRTAPAPR